jgi:predicted small lipoprotein YifL
LGLLPFLEYFMKKSLIWALLAVSFAITACGNGDKAPAKNPAAATSATADKPAADAVKAEDAPREATYDANLKPAEIVWDSPEKQKAWEARQAELKQNPAAHAPAAPAAHAPAAKP